MEHKEVNKSSSDDGNSIGHENLHVREPYTLGANNCESPSKIGEEVEKVRDVAIRPGLPSETESSVADEHAQVDNAEEPIEPVDDGSKLSSDTSSSHQAAHDPPVTGLGRQGGYAKTVRKPFARLILMISAVLSALGIAVHLSRTRYNVFDSGRFTVKQAMNRNFAEILLHTVSFDIHLFSVFISVVVRIVLLVTALHILDFILPALNYRQKRRDIACCGDFLTGSKRHFTLRCQITGSQFSYYLSLSKTRTKERGRKGKHQRWKKIHHIGQYSDLSHFFSLRPQNVGAHLRSATVFPVNQQKHGQSPPASQGSGEQPPTPAQQGASNRQWPPESVNSIPWLAFRDEWQRLKTFADMPMGVPVFVTRLAQAGFLRLADGNIVCCFCGLTHNMWQPGDVPANVHRRESPRCPLVTGINCDNQPISPVPEDQEAKLLMMWSVKGGVARQPAFVQEIPEHVGQGQLPQSSAGTLGSSVPSGPGPALPMPADAVSGPASLPVAQGSHQQPGGVSADFHSLPSAALGVDAHAGEQNGAPQAGPNVGAVAGGSASVASNPMRDAAMGPIIDGTAQPVIPPPSLGQEARDTARSSRGQGQQVVTYEQLGISTEVPKRTDMAMINARVASFRNWPPHNSHTPLQLAEAGFYYAGYADCGRCFFCGGGLKNWEANDNPWVEHARWFARCPYVRQCQGQDFVDIVQDLNTTRQQISMEEVKQEIRRRRAEGEHLQEPVVDPAISSALDNGYTQEQIDQAVQRLHQQGFPLNADKLLDFLQEEGAQAVGGHDDAGDNSDYEPGSVSTLVEENSEIRQQRMCKICLDKEVCIVFLPCGHLVCCAECSPAIRNCPMCRQKVKGRVRAFPA